MNLPFRPRTGTPAAGDGVRRDLPAELLADGRLCATARLIAVALVTHWARVKDHCWPSDRTIAARVGRSSGHVQRCLRQLERAGWIDREHTDEVPSGRRIWLLWRCGAGARRVPAPARGPPGAGAQRTESSRNRRKGTGRGPGSQRTTTGGGPPCPAGIATAGPPPRRDWPADARRRSARAPRRPGGRGGRPPVPRPRAGRPGSDAAACRVAGHRCRGDRSGPREGGRRRRRREGRHGRPRRAVADPC